MLWEDSFYEEGHSIADRIVDLCSKVSAQELSTLAIEARNVMHLRHVPLLLCVELARKGGRIVGDTLYEVIQRTDELTEFLSLYWRNGRRPLSAQVKQGLARAFHKFDEYSLGKYDRGGAVKLRDVLFLCHARPRDEVQEALWKRLIASELTTPDTWEGALSSGANKRETWTHLLTEERLGYLALLRNLRGMTEAGVDNALIRSAILRGLEGRGGVDRVLPFRFVAAARACPRFEPELDRVLLSRVVEPWVGLTVVLVDVSYSMTNLLSAKSDLTRMTAAAALGALIPGDVRLFSFSDNLVEVPPRKGLAGVDAILGSQTWENTNLSDSVRWVNKNVVADRLIVITDEQSTSYGRVPDPVFDRAYMINVASYENGVGYGKWVHFDGFSEGVLNWIGAYERGF
jgi:hypothetical protein